MSIVPRLNNKPCHYCGVADGTVSKSKMLPKGMAPAGPCKCAQLCRECRTLGMRQRLHLTE